MRQIICALLFAIAVTAMAENASSQKELEQWTSDFVAAWAKNDVEKLASVFADNGDILDPFGVHVRGREEVSKFVRETQESAFKGSSYNIRKSDIRMVTPEVAVLDWDVVITGVKGGGDQPEELKHHMTWVMHKRDGKWMAIASRPQAALPRADKPAKTKL